MSTPPTAPASTAGPTPRLLIALPDVVCDPSTPQSMDNEGGAPVAAPRALAEARRRHAAAVAQHAAARKQAEAHSDKIRDAYAAIDLARPWKQTDDGVEEGWWLVARLEKESTAIWARAHWGHWTVEWARADVARVQAALGLPVDDVDLLGDGQRDAYIASLTDEQRAELAGPWPVEWLYSPRPGDPIRIVNLFAGPGGWCEGIATVLGEQVDMVGVDLSEGACATARAAGHRRICASVTDLDPAHRALRYVVAVILSPPCQTLSPGGKRAGLEAAAMDVLEDVITEAGAAAGFIMVDDAGDGLPGYAPPTGASWAEVRAPLAALDDPRTGLMVEAVLWPLALQAKFGNIRWVAMEQSSNLLKSPAAEYVVEAISSEFYAAGWEYAHFDLLEAADYGAASKRNRTFLVCMRYTRPFLDYRPATPMPTTTWAECMKWEKGHKVVTRGVRGIDPNTGRPKGGGTFNADRPGTTVTGTAYGWKREADGLKHSHADLGRAVGFRPDYPWKHVGRGEGIRNKTQLIADPVAPMVAAAWIGHIIGREWEARTRDYVRSLYAQQPAVVPDMVTDTVQRNPCGRGESTAGGQLRRRPSAEQSSRALVPAARAGTAAGAPPPRGRSRRQP